MYKSKTEINFLRLMNVCESIVDDQEIYENWRFNAYVETLSKYLKELKQATTLQPSKENFLEYQRKVLYLKSLLPETSEFKSINTPSENDHGSVYLRKLKTNNTDLSFGFSNKAPLTSKKLFVQVSGEKENNLRRQLLSNRLDERTAENFDEDAFLKTNRDIQEELTEQMAALVRGLKTNVTTTATIVKKDNKMLADSMMIQSKNLTKLKEASDKLDITKSKANPCWVWVILILVFALFFWMILFIKLFSKKH